MGDHASHADTMVVVTTMPGRFHEHVVVAAAADYFFPNRVTALLTAVFVGAIPVEPRPGRPPHARPVPPVARRGVVAAALSGGRAQPDGEIQEFRPGTAWMARRAGVPVVPVRIDGTQDVLPKGRAFPHHAPVHVTYGEPLVLADGEDARSFGRRIEQAVHDLGSVEQSRWALTRQATIQSASVYPRCHWSEWARACTRPGDVPDLDHDVGPIAVEHTLPVAQTRRGRSSET